MFIVNILVFDKPLQYTSVRAWDSFFYIYGIIMQQSSQKRHIQATGAIFDKIAKGPATLPIVGAPTEDSSVGALDIPIISSD